MGVSDFFQDVWDFMCRPFEDCKSCTEVLDDVLDPYYYSKTSPGVRRVPPTFDRARWDNDLKYDFSLSRPPPSQSPANSRVVFTLSRSRSHSASRSFEEEDQQIQFLFYSGRTYQRLKCFVRVVIEVIRSPDLCSLSVNRQDLVMRSRASFLLGIRR
ncbi:hypothetical protein P3T76_004796 [Phytophthora citrophthora]|uniref:Uncharacterized protein n=1 Tax=Phytophthora citrophthora TaxID=4793 RepID=A0AAD9LNB3_9STRA|nr:hypothetical protein P3T76_004796 [Phytophthora citrophthora]